jgi:hypothetical protein
MAYFNGKKIFFSPKVHYSSDYIDIIIPEIKDDVLILTQPSDKNKAEISDGILVMKKSSVYVSGSALVIR